MALTPAERAAEYRKRKRDAKRDESDKTVTAESVTKTDPIAGLAPDVVETINRLCPVLPDMTDLQTSERTRRIAAAQHYAHLYPHKAAQHTGVPYDVQCSMGTVQPTEGEIV